MASSSLTSSTFLKRPVILSALFALLCIATSWAQAVDPTDSDCNYLNYGGWGMPMGICRWRQKFVCNDTYTGVNAEYYEDSSTCGEGEPIEIKDYSNSPGLTSFQCNRNSSSCNVVSVTTVGWLDMHNCDYVDDIWVYPLVLDTCLVRTGLWTSDPTNYTKFECINDSVQYSVYETDDCSEDNVLFTTDLEEYMMLDIDAMCAVEIEGCGPTSTAEQTSHGDSQITVYVIAGIGTLVFVAIVVVLAKRFCRRKIEEEVVTAATQSHSVEKVSNPYGQLTSINEASTPKKEQQADENVVV